MSKGKTASALRIYADTLKGKDRALLFAAVAERIRTCLLTEDEAALLAEWFERLSKGDDPKKVLFGETRGRPKGGTNSKQYGGGPLPDPVDLTWNLRQWIARTGDDDGILKLAAKHFGCTTKHLKELYRTTLPTLADDPSLPKK